MDYVKNTQLIGIYMAISWIQIRLSSTMILMLPFMAKRLLFICIPSALMSCTLNMSMVHNEGQSTDLMDTATTPTTTVSPKLSVPIKAI